MAALSRPAWTNPPEGDAAGPHYAVILDSDGDVKEHDSYWCAVISHNDQIDSIHLMPVPGRTGLTGFIVASWITEIHLAGITEVGPKLLPPEITELHTLVRQADAARRAQKTAEKS
jgi:hypothetical protein